ncbi:hypothetical protein ACFQRB_20090 [Halobaculum litoreum]|uniref:Uncharacterized protein n=1 Tax=Halobaculum litoreum TaxID=3031998 RepID=A0ABD5XSN4_9EURY
MTIYGRPMRSNEIEATVAFAGEELGTVGLGKRDGSPNRFRFSL